MPRQEPLFDPYLAITDLGADVRLVGQPGEKRVQINWWRGVPSAKRQKGEQYARAYDRLLRLQLATEPPRSVQKLLALGYIVVRDRRFIPGSARQEQEQP